MRRDASTLLVLIVLAGTALPLNVGCGPRPLTWSELTRHYNQTFASEGGAIVYRDVGRADAALTVVMIHGLAGSMVDWALIAPHLRDDYRVILVDLLGHGASSKGPDLDLTTAGQAAALDALLAAIDPPAYVLVGVSYGGGVALELARRRWVTRDSGQRGLVLIGPAALYWNLRPEQRFVLNDLLRDMIVYLGSGPQLAWIGFRNAFHRDDRIPELILHERGVNLSALETRKSVGRAARSLFAELAAGQSQARERYGLLGTPTLIVTGEHDEVVPVSVSRRLARILPQSRLLIYDDCGHTPNLEQPRRLRADLEAFLQRVSACASAARRVGSCYDP